MTERVFFALWLPPTVAQLLHEHSQRLRGVCGGRVVPRENLHLTLAFLGGISHQAVAAAKAVASKVSAPAFALQLDHQGLWRHNGIFWAACQQPPRGLLVLASALGQGLTDAGFSLEKRSFAPHVTLLRHARDEGASLPPMPDAGSWPVREFVLARSHPADGESRYELIGRWPLAAAPAPLLSAGED